MWYIISLFFEACICYILCLSVLMEQKCSKLVFNCGYYDFYYIVFFYIFYSVADEEGKLPTRPKNFRPLYDIPWMYEAREFLRKKLIGKKVNVTVDYIQPARDNFPEKCCCTVTISNV